ARRFLSVYIVHLAGKLRIVGACVAQSHLQVQLLAPRHVAAQDFLYLEPVLAVILLEDATRAEGAQHAKTDGFLDFRRRLAIHQRPSPYLYFAGSARMPHAHRLDHREKRKGRKNGHVPAKNLRGAWLANPLGRLSCRRSHVPCCRDRAVDGLGCITWFSEKAGPMSVAGAELSSDCRQASQCRVGSLRQLRDQRRQMAVVGVIHVGAELLGRELPIALEHPSMHPADHLGAAGGSIEISVDIPEHVAEIFAQGRSVLVPVAEDQSVYFLYARHLQRPPLTFVEFVAVAVFLVRDRYEVAADVVAPAVVRAGKRARVAAVRAADAHPAMTALVQERAYRSVFLPDHQHG